MPEQNKKPVKTGSTASDQQNDCAPETPPPPAKTEKTKQLKEDLDKIMDEIDDVLEENAEEFVKSYVQRGGE